MSKIMFIRLLEKLNHVNKNIWFLLIFLAAVILYLFNMNFSDLWVDEAFTKALVKHSFGDITSLIKNDFHPPLYFYGLKIFVSLLGASDFAVRLFSILGVLATILIGYFVGQRVFGKPGALYFCLLIISMPMLASFSHEARMYTWGAFSVTGVYLYSILFISENKRKDLILLMLFSLIAAYTHYYSLLAAFSANVFVALFLIAKHNKSWRIHLGYSIITALLYLPWLLVLLSQFSAVRKSFWVPEITWAVIFSCLTSPFAHKIWLAPSWTLLIIFYSLTLWEIYRNYILRKDGQGIKLSLSLIIFWFPFLTAIAISLLTHSILFPRYLANLVVMLLVPPVLFFISVKNRWIKASLITFVLVFSIVLAYNASYFSYGPYKQSVEYLHNTYPAVTKVFHIIEVSAGPFAEYDNYGVDNYWYKTDSTVVYTNMDVFRNLKTTDSLGKVLKKDELFSAVSFPYLPFNDCNLKQILSESQIIKADTLFDNKVEYGSSLICYILKYKGVN
jgi:uncharacterized membrane protein